MLRDIFFSALAGTKIQPVFWLTCSIIAAAVFGPLLRSQSWFAGTRATGRPFAWRQIPRRYLKDVHAVVVRERASAYMHACVAGGTVLSAPLLLLAHGPMNSPALAVLLLAALSVCGVGVLLLHWRRVNAPARLSKGAFDRLPWSLSGFVAFCTFGTLPLLTPGQVADWSTPWGGAFLVIGVLSALDLAVAFAAGPLKHAAVGALHLGAHPHPERFGGAPATTVALLPLDTLQIGARTVEDLPWNRILSVDACVECGKCEAACPAFAAGAPLNPKALVQSIARTAIAPWSFKYTGSAHAVDAATGASADGASPGNARKRATLVGDDAIVKPETLWACTTCRACVQECPMLIEHVDLITDMRRFQTMELGVAPGSANKALRNLRHADHLPLFRPGEQLLWMNDLPVRILRAGEACDVLLWVGSSNHEARGRQALRAFVSLMVRANLSFAILGEQERDCGDTARRLGDEASFQRLARTNIKTLTSVRFDSIVTTDPHALHCLKNEYRQLGASYEVRHHSELLRDLLLDGRLQVSRSGSVPTTYHDPCYLGRYNGIVDAPREVLELLGVDLTEMHRSGMGSRCCGGGGGVPLTNVRGTARISELRMDDARATQTKQLVVSCPGCMTMLTAVSGPRPEVRDIAELVRDAIA